MKLGFDLYNWFMNHAIVLDTVKVYVMITRRNVRVIGGNRYRWSRLQVAT